jgi:hypothetical protein
VDEQLILRPFPIGIKNADERQRTFTRYREELVAQAGIAVFIMGNKEVDGKVVSADGVRAEFELAKSKGLYVVPVGSSGSMASELWKEVMGDAKKLFPKNFTKIRPLLEAIGKPVKSPDKLLKPILELIDLLSEE